MMVTDLMIFTAVNSGQWIVNDRISISKHHPYLMVDGRLLPWLMIHGDD